MSRIDSTRPDPATTLTALNPGAVALAAALLYACVAASYPWAKPGLQYDEALFMRDAVQILTSSAKPTFAHEQRSSIPVARRFFPIMDLPYAGPIKGYLVIVPFAIFGTGAAVSRAFAVLLTTFGIWGITRTLGREISAGVGAAVGVVLAVHPAILDQTLYDNSIVALWIATLGLVCLAFSRFLRSFTARSAFALGAAAGFAVWGRLNFLWLLGAIVISTAVAVPGFWSIRRRALPLAAGFVFGSSPVLLWEAITRVRTLRFIQIDRVKGPWFPRAIARLSALCETLLSDSEHRCGLWGGPFLPAWQIVFATSIAIAGVSLALFSGRGPREGDRDAAWRRASALVLLIFVSTMATSRLNIGEHHLVTAVPVAALATILGIRRLASVSRAARASFALAGSVFLALCVGWNFRSAAGIRATGGIGVWSDAVENVTATLQLRSAGRTVRVLTWGLANNVFVLSRGTVALREVFWKSTEDASDRGRPWIDEIRDGGFFLSGEVPSAANTGFRRALESSGAPFRRWAFRERRGAMYAELFQVFPSGSPAEH